MNRGDKVWLLSPDGIGEDFAQAGRLIADRGGRTVQVATNEGMGRATVLQAGRKRVEPRKAFVRSVDGPQFSKRFGLEAEKETEA